MDRVKDEPIKVYINDFEIVIDNTLEELEITDRYKIPASQWSYILMQMYEQIIKPNEIELIRVKNNINHEIDINKLLDIFSIYTNLCIKYIQVINITDFSMLTGIDRTTIYAFSDKKLSSGRFDILQKFKELNEKTLINTQQARGYNPILTMAQLNKNHGYNGAGTSNEKERKKITSLADAPTLTAKPTPTAIESH